MIFVFNRPRFLCFGGGKFFRCLKGFFLGRPLINFLRPGPKISNRNFGVIRGPFGWSFGDLLGSLEGICEVVIRGP